MLRHSGRSGIYSHSIPRLIVLCRTRHNLSMRVGISTFHRRRHLLRINLNQAYLWSRMHRFHSRIYPRLTRLHWVKHRQPGHLILRTRCSSQHQVQGWRMMHLHRQESWRITRQGESKVPSFNPWGIQCRRTKLWLSKNSWWMRVRLSQSINLVGSMYHRDRPIIGRNLIHIGSRSCITLTSTSSRQEHRHRQPVLKRAHSRKRLGTQPRKVHRINPLCRCWVRSITLPTLQCTSSTSSSRLSSTRNTRERNLPPSRSVL